MPQKPIIPGQLGQPVIGSRFDVSLNQIGEDSHPILFLENVPGNKVLSCIDILQPGQVVHISLTKVD